jgi:hypothetical protein
MFGEIVLLTLKIKNHTGYLLPVVRQSSSGMLQRPTLLRFPTREYRQRETRGFLVGLVLRRLLLDRHPSSADTCAALHHRRSRSDAFLTSNV